jgi:hypothetical protein
VYLVVEKPDVAAMFRRTMRDHFAGRRRLITLSGEQAISGDEPIVKALVTNVRRAAPGDWAG